MNKRVSVIIPTYGGPDFLERCINSVLAQTYNNIEAVVVDDNGLGTEQQLRTEKVMRQYADDGRVKYVCHDVNINGSAARNTGVKNSTGDYIALMDDDDIFYPEKIERQVRLMETLPEDYAVTYCACDIYYRDKKVGESKAEKSGKLLYECLTHQIQIASTSMLIRKSAYLSIGGFDESFRRHQDWEFIARIAAKYSIRADNFIGFRRYLEFRNKLGTPEIYKERRLYYLKKMAPLIETLSSKQQKEVVVGNRMEVALMFLKHKRYIDFIKEYKEIAPGLMGVKWIIKRLGRILGRGKLRMAN